MWAGRHLFQLDAAGRPTVVAGVPPDYFSATGQRWGNPLYHWPAHEADGFEWWRRRVGKALQLYDAVCMHPAGEKACHTAEPGANLAKNITRDCLMSIQPELNRRRFIQTTALAAAALPFIATEAEAASPAKGKPKVGCVSWCFHDLSPGADPEPATDQIGGLGFDGIELIVTASRDLKGFWTDARIDRYKRKLDRYHLRVSQFVLFQPVVEGLSSLEADARNRSLDHFEAGCGLARKLNAPIINIVAPWALALKGPDYYLPRYYEVSNPKPGEKFHIDIAPGFDFDEVWGHYVETMRQCVARAKAHGLRFTIEQHTHTLVPASDAFRRLWDRIQDPALGYNLDAGWTLLEREYPPEAIYKVRPHLMNLHIRDIDAHMRFFPPIGDGVMDFQAIVAALRETGFGGYADLEQDSHPGDPPMVDTCRRYLRMMRNYIG